MREQGQFTKGFKAELKKLQVKIDQMLERMVELSSPSVIRAFEQKIETLER